MPGYAHSDLQRFQHPTPSKPQHYPLAWLKRTYGAKTRLVPLPDDSSVLPPDQVERLQQIIGVFFFYARTVNSIMLGALGTLAAQQAKTTVNTNIAVQNTFNRILTTTNSLPELNQVRSPTTSSVSLDTSHHTDP